MTTSGRGPSWRAEITQAGRDYLEKVDGPNPPIPRQANASVTQQLVDEVIASGGSLRVAKRQWGSKEGVDWEQRAHVAPVNAVREIDCSQDESQSRMELWLAAPGQELDRALALPL